MALAIVVYVSISSIGAVKNTLPGPGAVVDTLTSSGCASCQVTPLVARTFICTFVGQAISVWVGSRTKDLGYTLLGVGVSEVPEGTKFDTFLRGGVAIVVVGAGAGAGVGELTGKQPLAALLHAGGRVRVRVSEQV